MTTSAIQMCRVIISACLYLKLGWTCYSASKYTLCTNENNLKRWEEVGIIHYPDKGLAHLGGSSVVHCRSVLRCGAGSSFQGKHSVVLGSHFLNIPRNVLVLIFPVPSQPAALSELKFTWFITDNKNLLPSCCSPGFISEFAPACHPCPVSVDFWLCVWGASSVPCTLGCVVHGGAELLCPSGLFLLLQQPQGFGSCPERWGKGWHRNGKTSSLNSQGSWECVGFPPSPSFYKHFTLTASEIFQFGADATFPHLIHCILSFMRPVLVKWQWWFGNSIQLSRQLPWQWFYHHKGREMRYIEEKIPWLTGVISTG